MHYSKASQDNVLASANVHMHYKFNTPNKKIMNMINSKITSTHISVHFLYVKPCNDHPSIDGDNELSDPKLAQEAEALTIA